jgi:hypothetical protein
VTANLRAADALVVVAVEAGDCVGTALAEPARADDGAGPVRPGCGHLSMVFVHPDRLYLGRGYRPTGRRRARPSQADTIVRLGRWNAPVSATLCPCRWFGSARSSTAGIPRRSRRSGVLPSAIG